MPRPKKGDLGVNAESSQFRRGNSQERGGRLEGGGRSSQSKNILQPQKHLRKNSSLEAERKNRALTPFPGRSAAIPAGLFGALFQLRGAGRSWEQGCLTVSSRTLPWLAAQQPNHHQIWAETRRPDSEEAKLPWSIVSRRHPVTLARTGGMGLWWAPGGR